MVSLLQRALRAVDREALERRLVEMVDIYSPPREEKEILAYLERQLEQMGLSYTRQQVEGGHHNLLITIGSGEPQMCLMGHVDTIPRRHMKDHRARQSEGRIAGLGSADMKSGVAAMIEAFRVLKAAGYPKDAPALLLALLVDEEDQGTGSARFVEAGAIPRFVIIGEPTDLRLCWQHFGYCELRLRTRGERVHSAIPEKGHNAIMAMMDVIRMFDQLDAMPGFEDIPQWMVFNLRQMIGSNADFTVPESCDAVVDFHLHPTLDAEAFRAYLDQMLSRFAADVPKARLYWEWDMSFGGFVLQPEEPLMQLAESASRDIGLVPSREIFRSHSDANILVQHGARCLMMGPGALGTAHTVHEYVETDELLAAARFYTALLLQYAEA